MVMNNTLKNNENKTNFHSDEKIEKSVDILKALSDSTRLKIIYLLKDGELCGCEILNASDKSQSTVSHHLNLLKRAGILNARKEGTWIHYSLVDENMVEHLNELFEMIID